MNAWDKRRELNGWGNGLVEWSDHLTKTAYLSVVFSWNLQEAYQRAVWCRQAGYQVKAGGPAVAMNPDFLSDVAEVNSLISIRALARHNNRATFTSRGCIRRCAFCAVPKIEGELVELYYWKPKPIICDNNLLACSRQHFDRVIDSLRFNDIQGVDFNQGLDARLLTKYHAERIAELHIKWVRLAWDHIRLESQFRAAHATLINAGIPKGKIGVYVLIGYRDTPEDALYRLDTVWNELGSWPFPMRYQPLDALMRNQYVGENWTDAELKRYVRYWSNLRHLSGVPFDEFRG